MSVSAHGKILSDFGNKQSVTRQRGESQNGGYNNMPYPLVHIRTFNNKGKNN